MEAFGRGYHRPNTPRATPDPGNDESDWGFRPGIRTADSDWGFEMSEPLPRVPAGAAATSARPKRELGRVQLAEQPFAYPLERAYAEPDWTRLPGYAGISRQEWESAQWQRKQTVKNLAELSRALGRHLDDDLRADIERDQRERATMSMLIPPQMINTMDERDLRKDPVRRYMAPAWSERDPEWPSHPTASRDSLH